MQTDKPVVRIPVIGNPAPKGSKSFRGMSRSGHAILTESSKAVKPWMEAVKWAIIEHGRPVVRGPVSVRIIFTLPKPKSAPKRRTTYPDRQPDLDKLERSTWDSLVQCGVIEDDARIIWSESGKVYPDEHADSLSVPGAVIEIRQVIAPL